MRKFQQLKRTQPKQKNKMLLLRLHLFMNGLAFTPIKLVIFNYSHIHHCESVVHGGSIIDIIIPKNCVILFHCELVHCGSS